MKKVVMCVMVIFMSLTFLPYAAGAVTNGEPASATAAVPPMPKDSAEVKVMLKRLDEITVLVKSDLKPSAKRELRKELRSINNNLKATGGVIYVSAGAIILIIILVILL